MIGDIIIGVLGNTAYDILKKFFKKHFGVDEDPILQLFIDSIKSTSSKFFHAYGDAYGTISSSFLSKENNWEILLKSIFYGAKEIDENSFDFRGLGIDRDDALAGAKNFIEILSLEMRKNRQLDKLLTEKKHIYDTAKHIEESQQRHSLIMETLNSKTLFHQTFPTVLINQKIKEELNTICKSRLFNEYDTVQSSLILAKKLIEGELSGGSNFEKSIALAWCARFLSSQEILKAKEYLELARSLEFCPEIDIAKALIISYEGDKNTALSILSGIDSPISRSASLVVVIHHEGAERAISWLQLTGMTALNLDPYGRYLLITYSIKLTEWDIAKKTIEILTKQDFEECPILHYILGIYYLQRTVPDELRSIVLNQVPFQSLDFPLASELTAIDTRRLAHRCFSDASATARQINCPAAARLAEEYAIWLELRDPDNSKNGRRLLESKLNDPKSALHLVPLALQFKIKLDLKAVEQEIERQITLNGGITQEAATARLALIFTKKTPNEAANFLAQHYRELTKYFDKTSLKFFQIELLLQAGHSEGAEEYIAGLLEEGISDEEEIRLRRLIAEAEGADPVEYRKVQFEKTGSLNDLIWFVDELETRDDWDSLCKYGEILFEKTRTVQDAERLANALINVNKSDRLVELIKANSEYLDQSVNLRMMYSWALYNEGNLLQSRSELFKFKDDQKNRNYRVLYVNLGIALGDWNSLTAFINNEIVVKDKRSPQDLINNARLALQLSLQQQAKVLIYAAVAGANDDADIYVSAYFLAAKAGIEGNSEITQWLYKAVQLSNDDEGPLQTKTLKEILDLKPEWDRRKTETLQLLSKGEIPQFLAAQSLNNTLIGLMLFPILANLTENDPRRRGYIPAYSGKRLPKCIENIKNIGFDATSLITLGYLNLLDQTFNTFDKVYIPHSTLKWLFEEKQKISFHQPSRISYANQLRNMLATEKLGKLTSNISPDSDLSIQIGDELAILIAEAEKARQETDIKCFVVRPFPVYRIYSLMEDEADLSRYAEIMSSCLSVVNALRRKGQITAEEEKRARIYLELHEKPWPCQPEITDGAILYLDDLAVNYFQHLGLLEKLKDAGFRPFVSSKTIFEANELISYESNSGTIYEIIERIRYAVSTRIESGKITVDRRHSGEKLKESLISEHPSISVIALASKCEVIISDDRFLNQHEEIDNGGVQAEIFSTLDILETLTSYGTITPSARLEYKTQLRRAGYFFIPVDEHELTIYLEDSLVVNEKLVETAELKFIRQNILYVRMSDFLQLPNEALWLNGVYEVYDRVLKKFWNAKADLQTVKAYSDWIQDQLDFCGWVHRFENKDYDVNVGRGVFILKFLSAPSDAPQDVKNEYWNWISEKVLFPIKEQYRDIFDWIIEWYKNQIIDTINNKELNKYNFGNSSFARIVLVQAILNHFPPMIQDSLLKDKTLRETYGLCLDAIVSLEQSADVSFKQSELFSAIRRFNSDTPHKEITDISGTKWIINFEITENNKPVLLIYHEKKNLVLPNFLPLLTDRSLRLRSLDEVISDVTYPVSARNKWSDVLSERSLDDSEIEDFYNDITDTPVYIANKIRKELHNGKISVSSLVPSSKRYYERLVGCYDGSSSIREYASGQCRQHFERLLDLDQYEGLLASLYLSFHSDLTAEIKVEGLETKNLIRAFEFLEANGDRVSQLGAIDVGLRILPSSPEIEPFILRIIKQIRADNVNEATSEIRLFSALFVLVDGELSRIRMFSTTLPFYRRLASLSHAALIQRQIFNSGINMDLFCDWALNRSGEQFFFQSLTDMRLETRWQPDFALASQFKAEFFARIIMSANKYEKNITDRELHDLIFGTMPESLTSFVDIHQIYFPGPLEGLNDSSPLLPQNFSNIIETQLEAEKLSPMSFISLVNFAYIFNIEKNHADMAASVLKLGRYRLSEVQDRAQLLAVLKGLASVAAVSRNNSLAYEIRVLVRVYRNDPQYALTINEAIRIYIVAAACYEDLNQWSEFVGECLTELAFTKLEDNEARAFFSTLQCLCHIVPELWITCGKADAALKSLIVN